LPVSYRFQDECELQPGGVACDSCGTILDSGTTAVRDARRDQAREYRRRRRENGGDPLSYHGRRNAGIAAQHGGTMPRLDTRRPVINTPQEWGDYMKNEAYRTGDFIVTMGEKRCAIQVGSAAGAAALGKPIGEVLRVSRETALEFIVTAGEHNGLAVEVRDDGSAS
jgi:hypothetical protein